MNKKAMTLSLLAKLVLISLVILLGFYVFQLTVGGIDDMVSDSDRWRGTDGSQQTYAEYEEHNIINHKQSFSLILDVS